MSRTENPTRELNTTSFECCLPSTDATDRRGKIHAGVMRSKRASLKSTRFSQKNEVCYFSSRPRMRRLARGAGTHFLTQISTRVWVQRTFLPGQEVKLDYVKCVATPSGSLHVKYLLYSGMCQNSKPLNLKYQESLQIPPSNY